MIIDSQMLQKRILKGIAPNCCITEAATGEEAIELCSKKSFDMIIMDHYMEGAGGVLVGTDVIRQMRRSGVASFIIGCSGNEMEKDFLAAGADKVWCKPIPNNQLIRSQFRRALKRQNGENSV